MSKLKNIYDSLLASGDLPEHYSGEWKEDKKLFVTEYSSNGFLYENDDEFEFDDTY